MRPRPVLLPFFGHAFRDAAHGQAGGIGGDDRAGLADLRDAREQRALDLEIFGDDFDNPVRVGAKFQVVFEVAGNDAILEAAREKCGRPGLHGCAKACADNTVTNFRAREGQPALLLFGRKVRRRDVQERARHPGIGDVRGDARAHGARAQDHDLFNRSLDHICYVRPETYALNPLRSRFCRTATSDRLGRPCRLQKRQSGVNEKHQAPILGLTLYYSNNDRK